MKKFIVFLIVIVMLLTMCGCMNDSAVAESRLRKNLPSNIISIDGMDSIYYDANTRIVYIIIPVIDMSTDFGFMSPYYAPNGLPYMYDTETNSLVEINNKSSMHEKENPAKWTELNLSTRTG